MSTKLRVFILLLLLIKIPLAQAQWYQFSSSAMTTKLDLEFWLEDELKATKISQRVFEEFVRVEKIMTRYGDQSELSMLNKFAAKQSVAVSDELFVVINKAQIVSGLSDGAFDMTFASVGYLYDFRLAQQPSESEIAKHVAAIDYRYVNLNKEKQTIRFKHDGVLIDLGGIAKGYAVDRGIEILRDSGVQFARLSAGGDMRLLGDKKGKPWIVGIKNPRAEMNTNEHMVALPLSGIAISTSGDYERFFINDKGKRVHHILSPKTGYSANGVQSVTILGPDSVTSDGLSTAVFVLGVKKGITLIESLPGIDVVIIDAMHKVHFSEGLMPPQ